MSDLVRFLLDRITEDEERGANCRDWMECDDGYGCPAHMSPVRWAAESKAKRRILAEIADGGDGEWVLHVLALPYVNHSDYRSEWKS